MLACETEVEERGGRERGESEGGREKARAREDVQAHMMCKLTCELRGRGEREGGRKGGAASQREGGSK